MATAKPMGSPPRFPMLKSLGGGVWYLTEAGQACYDTDKDLFASMATLSLASAQLDGGGDGASAPVSLALKKIREGQKSGGKQGKATQIPKGTTDTRIKKQIKKAGATRFTDAQSVAFKAALEEEMLVRQAAWQEEWETQLQARTVNQQDLDIGMVRKGLDKEQSRDDLRNIRTARPLKGKQGDHIQFIDDGIPRDAYNNVINSGKAFNVSEA